MKNSLLLAALFLFYFLIFLIFLTIISVLYLIISNHIDILQLPSQNVYFYIIYSLIEVLPGAILFALILLFFRILQKPGKRILSYLLTVITATLVLAGGIKVFQLIAPEKPKGSMQISSLIEEGKFIEIGEYIFYTDEIRNNILINNLLLDTSSIKRPQSLYFSNRAYAEEYKGKMEITFSGKVRKKIIIENEFLKARQIGIDFFTRELLSSYNILTSELKKLASGGNIEFFLFCLAFTFLIMTTNVFMRISKWSLFNFIFLFFIITGIFFLYKLFNTIILVELHKLITNNFLLTLIPVIGMFIIGIFFFLFDIIFVPFVLKEKDLSYE